MPTRLRPVGAVLATVLLVVLGTALLTVPTAAPGHAHDYLLDAEPADGAALNHPPDVVRLTFSDQVLPTAPAVLLRRGDTVLLEAEPDLDGRVAEADLPDDLPDGEYTVAWRVVSADGHPVSGLITFTVGTVTAGETATPAETQDAASPSAGPTEPTTAAAAPATVPAALVAAGVVLLAATATTLLALLAVHRRRRRPTTRENP